MLKSRLCDHSDAYILVKGTMTVPNMTATAAYAKNANKNVIFKNCVPFTNCISEINNTQIDNAEDSDVVILMETLIEYSNSYLKTSGILWQYCRDESAVVDDGAIVNVVANNTTSSFKIKGKKKTGQTSNGGTKSVEIMVPLKYLSNFWRTFKMPLMN